MKRPTYLLFYASIKVLRPKKIIELITTHPKESRKEWMLKMFKEARANNSRNRHVQFWQQDNHPVKLTTNEMIDQRLNYIHNNSVRAYMVANAKDYIYSSARDYCGEKGLVKLCMMD